MTPDPNSTAAGPGPERHSVWGRVVDPGGKPVPAEVFWVHGTHRGEETVDLFDVHKVAHADADGRFWAPDLPAGPCLLVADFRRMAVDGERVHIGQGLPLSVPVGVDEVVLTFPKRRTEFGSVHGVVRDKMDGRPATRIHVALLDDEDRPLREAETATNGRFEFPFLPSPATYHVAVWGTRRHLPGRATLELGANRRIDATIDQHRRPDGPRCEVHARVEDPLGLPVARAVVRLTMPGVTVAPGRTDGAGLSVLADLPERPVAVLAAAPGFWPVAAAIPEGAVEGPVEVRIALDRAARLRIAVRDRATGRALRHANLLVRHQGGDQWIWGGVLPPPDHPPRDHQDVEVRTGPVTVRAESPGYRRSEVRIEIPDLAAEVHEVTIDLDPA